jgi:hypothetical protein
MEYNTSLNIKISMVSAWFLFIPKIGESKLNHLCRFTERETFSRLKKGTFE